MGVSPYTPFVSCIPDNGLITVFIVGESKKGLSTASFWFIGCHTLFIVYPARWKVGLKFVIREGIQSQITVAEMWL
jgi:hypothetical protein